MSSAARGMTVTVNYTARLDDGKIVDSTLGGPGLEFVVGEGRVLKGFEEAVVGMKAGETKTVRLEAEECYGNRQEDLVVSVPKSKLPEESDVKVGQAVKAITDAETEVYARVTSIDESHVTLDANHLLAGQPLTFEIAVLEVSPP